MKLLVLDGNSIVNRAFYGIKPLTTKNGEFTNAIYGFLTILNKMRAELSPDCCAIAFDLKAPTFRHKAYAGYKAGRHAMPEELASQMPVLKELLGYLGYTIVSCEGYEADDILGTFAKKCEATGDVCYIATGDRDSLQLVSEATTVRLATTKFGQSSVTLYDTDKIMEVYGVTPPQLIDIKAIQGDTSDKIPGAAGIGEKGAKDLISRFGSVKYIYEHIDELDIKPGMKKKLIDSKENVELSYFLGKINCEVPIDTEISHYEIKPVDVSTAAPLMSRLELFKLMESMNIALTGASSAQMSLSDLTESKPEFKHEVLADGAKILAMCSDEGRAYFLTEYDDEGRISKMHFTLDDTVYTFEPSEIFLKSFAENKNIQKFTHDIKPFHKAVMKMGLTVNSPAFDSVLAAYLLNPSASGYDTERLEAEYSVFVPELDTKEAGIAAAFPALCDKLGKDIDARDQRELLSDIELPLAEVLAAMENEGFMANRDDIIAYGEKLRVRINELVSGIKAEVGDINLNSPKQLGTALFETMGLPHGKKTKTGYSTNADVLEPLRWDYPVVNDILEYRALSKLSSTYVEGLLKVIGEDGRIHSSFNQTETRTGRISSTEPNLQNIPVRTELGREMRKFFVARDGWTLVDADYSQIELRVLAHVANDKVMIDSFNSGKDIHRSTAAKVFGIPEDMVTSKMRSRAKAVNFGIVYGIGAFSLSKDIGVSVKEANAYIDEYLKNFSGVRDYMDTVIANAKEKGYAEDIFGRRRYLPELSSSNFSLRAFGERVARNMPIQGAAADIIKIAMVKVFNRLKEENLEARLILQVHDELIVECPEAEADKVKSILEEEMSGAVKMSVPMIADANIGKDWFLAKG
ncbi:MAG: DNA polymerase I [Clostridia bacterium]|nr:DNA polymerase I [Clostridia bacterium]